MRTAFEQHSVLNLRTDIAMAKYTEPGDPLKLDFAYALNEKLKVFQAVSLKGDLGARTTLDRGHAGLFMILLNTPGPRLY